MPPYQPYPRPDAALLALRPVIDGQPTALPASFTVADFQHQVLRPLLKLQHAMLVALVDDFAHDYRLSDPITHPVEAARQRHELLTRNTRLRATLTGVIIGLLTTPEVAFYQQHRNELNRRLLELAVVRLSHGNNG